MEKICRKNILKNVSTTIYNFPHDQFFKEIAQNSFFLILCHIVLYSRVGSYWNWDKRPVGNNKQKCFLNQSAFTAEVITFRVMQYIKVHLFIS
jgi:hypothetical protein